MEHPFDITADGNGMFPKPKEDSQQTSSQCWPWQEVVIEALAIESERAIKDYSVFPIIVRHKVQDVP